MATLYPDDFEDLPNSDSRIGFWITELESWMWAWIHFSTNAALASSLEPGTLKKYVGNNFP